MANENDVSSESSPVTDADLDAALQNMDVEVAGKGKKEKAKEGGEKPIEQLDGSMLGRKVKQVMDENKQLKDSLAQILERLDEFRYRPPKDESVSRTDELPETILTPQDVIKVNQYQKKQEAEEQTKYSNNYIKEFKSLRSRDPELFDEIWEEMTTNFDRRLSDNPKYDAMLNYADAKSSLLSKKIAPTATHKKKSVIPTDLSLETRETPSAEQDIVLDPLADEFAKSVGMSKESIRKALNE